MPNATLVAFDFSSFVNEQLVFTGDNYFCLCLLVPADLGPPTRVGGSVMSVGGTAAAKPVPAPDLLPPWPEEAMNGSRESSKFDFEL